MSYAALIRDTSPAAAAFDARHIEAWMRSQYGTLDALSPAEFGHAVRHGIACVETGGITLSENLAQSYGL